MNRLIFGAVSALLLAAAGMFWWQGRAGVEAAAPPVPGGALDGEGPVVGEPPSEDGAGLMGEGLPEADPATREEQRFNRVDRNRDNLISRNEMLSPRVAFFKKLDTDHNNLLSFEEWAVATSNKFKGADANGDGELTRKEFATTRPKPAKRPACRC